MKRIGLLVCFVAMLGNSAFGAETSTKSNGVKMPAEITADQRQKMADIHDKMAVCLRSDRPMADCHQEMMTACKSTMGKNGCPMMSEKMGHGMKHHMMDESADKKE